MTYGARLFLIILAFQFLTANPVPLEFPIIPKIDCDDLNGNGYPDFVAVNGSVSPRSLYHIEYKDSNIEFLWEYSMPENIQGYFAHMIFGDFDNDGGRELIAVAYQEGRREIFYVFSLDVSGFNSSSPQIMGIGNSYLSIAHPRKLYPMNADSEGHRSFILTQGSPSRHIILCKYIDGEINSVGSFGKKFLSQSAGPLELSLGNFDKDNIEDIFILSNGQNPKGYFIFSDGSEENANLGNYPRLRLLHNRGVDINFDGIDDLLMVNRIGGLMSNIWGKESIALSESKIQDILVTLDNGLIHLNSISQTGKIGNYTIDPLTRSILTSEYSLPEFMETTFERVYSLVTANHIFLINDGKNPELWSSSLSMDRMTERPPPDYLQRIYTRTPDYVINVGDLFIHSIEKDTIKAFLHFTGEYLPLGMKFNLDDVQLEWVPTKSQLGFHEFSYTLKLRERGDLEMSIENERKLVSQMEKILEEKNAYLIYVNDPVKFNTEEDHLTIVNTKPFEWIVPINDENVDAWLTVNKISGEKEVIFQLLQNESDHVSLNLSIVSKIEILDTLKSEVAEGAVIIDNVLDSMYVDTVDDPFLTSIDEIIIESILDTQFQEIAYSEIVSHNAKLSWTPKTDPNDYYFTLTVSDGYMNDTLDITLTIHPEIDLNMNETEFIATVNRTFSTSVEHKQIPPSENVSYELLGAPENMRITRNGIINWIPLTTQVDNYAFNVAVSDGIALSELQYNIYVNAIPVISSRPSEQLFITQGDSFSFPLESFDMNTDAELTWKLLSGPTDMILDFDGVLKWPANQLDHHPYEILLSDGIDSVKWNGSIYVNVPPTITSKPVTFIPENVQYKYPLEARDDNKINPLDVYTNNKIEFKLLNGPPSMVIDYQNILRWEPPENVSGEFFVSIIATDGIANTPQNFQLLVNSFPILTSTDSLSVKIGDTLNVYVKANDSNLGDSLSYFIDDMPPGMNLDNATGLLTWIPSKSDIGQHYFNLKVKDGHSAGGSDHELQIFVYMLPLFSSDILTEAFVGLEYAGFLSGVDMFGKKLREEKSIIIEMTTIKDFTISEYGRYFQWTPGEMDTGNHEIHIRITDKYGVVNLHTHRISVFKNPCLQCDGNPGASPIDTTRN